MPSRYIGKRRGRRPQLCRTCHAPATHCTQENRLTTTIKLDGKIRRGQETISVFWCAIHGEPVKVTP